jgi:hypothetical protein
MTTANTVSVMIAFERAVMTRIHDGHLAFVSRKPRACNETKPVLVPSAKKSHRNSPMIRFER